MIGWDGGAEKGGLRLREGEEPERVGGTLE